MVGETGGVGLGKEKEKEKEREKGRRRGRSKRGSRLPSVFDGNWDQEVARQERSETSGMTYTSKSTLAVSMNRRGRVSNASILVISLLISSCRLSAYVSPIAPSSSRDPTTRWADRFLMTSVHFVYSRSATPLHPCIGLRAGISPAVTYGHRSTHLASIGSRRSQHRIAWSTHLLAARQAPLSDTFASASD